MATQAGTIGSITINSIQFQEKDTPGMMVKIIKPVGLASAMLMWDGKGAYPTRMMTTTYTTRGTDVTQNENNIKAMQGTVQTMTVNTAAQDNDIYFVSVEKVIVVSSPCLIDGDDTTTDTKTVGIWDVLLMRSGAA